MRILFQALLVVFLLAVGTPAQDNDEWPTLGYLKNDYRAVNTVAHVKVHDAEIVNRIPGYESWRINCEIVESLKGPFRKGQKLQYFHGAEAGFRKELFLGEKIVFLLREFDNKEKKSRYVVLENSTLPYNEDRIRKLRTIRRSASRRKAR